MALTALIPRTRKMFELEGYVTARTEYYSAAMRRRVDLFGFIDAIAVHPLLKRTIAIQVTSQHNVQAHIVKIAQLEAAYFVLSAGWEIALVGWEKPARKYVSTILKLTPEILLHYKTPQQPVPTTQVSVNTDSAGEPAISD